MKSILLLSVLVLTACGGRSSAGSYPLSTCVVSGEKLGGMGEPVIVHFEGKEVRLCCKQCLPKFQADQAGYAAKVR